MNTKKEETGIRYRRIGCSLSAGRGAKRKEERSAAREERGEEGAVHEKQTPAENETNCAVISTNCVRNSGEIDSEQTSSSSGALRAVRSLEKGTGISLRIRMKIWVTRRGSDRVSSRVLRCPSGQAVGAELQPPLTAVRVARSEHRAISQIASGQREITLHRKRCFTSEISAKAVR